MTEENIIITPTSLLRRYAYPLESAGKLYELSHQELINLKFQKFNSDPEDKLYLFPAYCYEIIPDGFIVEEIKCINYKYERKFIEFKYDPNFTKNNNECEYSYFKFIQDKHKKYLDIGLNISYTYDELIIKNILE